MRSMVRRSTPALAAALLLAAGTGEIEAQDVTLDASAVEIDLSGRVQVQAATSSCSSSPFEADSPCVEQVPSLDLFTRRIRLSAFVTIDDFVSAKIEPDFGGLDGVEMRDAYGRLTFGPGAKLQVGQFKRPFDGFNLVSSSQLLTIERDVDVPGVPGLRAGSLSEFVDAFGLGSYDVGAMLFGTVADGRLDYHAGVFNGEPVEENGDTNGEKQLVGRLTYRLSAGELPVELSAAAAWTDRAVQDADDRPGTRLGSDRYADYQLWARLGDYEPGPHVQAGLVFGDNPTRTTGGASPGDAPLPADTEYAAMRAWQVIGAWRFAVPGTDRLEAVEPVFRVTRAEPNTDAAEDENWAFTPGVNVYFHGRNKLQLGWDFASFAGDRFDSVSSFKSQFQVYF